MFWLVKTRFSAGIWLHDPANDHRGYIRRALYISMDDYESALKRFMEEAAIQINAEELIPNRLYQIKDDRIYVVFFNKRLTGFSERDAVDEFMNKNKMQWRYYRKRWRLTYRQAVSMVTALGAITGEDKIFGKKSPVCGRLYRRLLE